MSFALRRPKSSSRSSSARGTIVRPEMRNIGATSGSSSGTRAPKTEAGRTDATATVSSASTLLVTMLSAATASTCRRVIACRWTSGAP